ncbi:Histone-lysine N-methyltransferase SETMAR [Sarcoptes scabiei]|uniref:Histone-lysine N-methyltransferase SETMAR n=1 Tax=Sarcoptes scabiei TaxID=52283 RepID=A0A834VHD6_SARSC|nr:Histone-lysine N-methyltransferase SETMAR [Sarcoptes scabiei]
MDMNKKKLRYILQYHYDRKDRAEKAAEKICETYGYKTISKVDAKKWYQQFAYGKVKEENEEQPSEEPIVTDSDRIKEFIESDRHASLSLIAKSLKIDQSTVQGCLQKFGLKKRYDVWLPEELTQKNLLDRINVCDWLLKRCQYDLFLQRMVTGDVKFITYENVNRKRSLSKRENPNQSLGNSSSSDDFQKVLLCVWWDYMGIIHYELLPPDQKLTADLFSEQLDRLKEAIDLKRPELAQYGVVLLYDNARPHINLNTRLKIVDLGWEVLLHPPNSPDLSPCDYYLFKSLQNSLNHVKLTSKEDVENHIVKFFNKPQDFYTNGMMGLSSKWSEVIEQNGAYLTG